VLGTYFTKHYQLVVLYKDSSGWICEETAVVSHLPRRAEEDSDEP
jgi:hypothetical protein